jgi:predicted RNase H-like nuclease (RuvC/YqgF family)
MDGETKAGMDALPNEGQPSPGEGSPSTPPEKTYTESEVNKRHAKLDKTVASLTRERDTLKQSLESVNTQLDELQRRIDESETEKYRDDPDGLKSLQAKRELRKQQDELKKQRQEIENEKTANADKLKRADELEVEITVWKVAQAHGIDANTLKGKCQKFNLTTEEQIEEMAQTLAGAGSSDDSNARQTLEADSNRSSGGGKDFKSVSFGPNAPSGSEMISEGLNKK